MFVDLSRHPRLLLLLLGSVVGALSLVPISASAQLTAHTVVVSADPVDWTPHVLDGQVNAVQQVGDTMVVGGTFTQQKEADPTAIARSQSFLFAFDATTGALDPNFLPQLDAAVEALAVAADGQSIFVGGDFTTASGADHRKLVQLDLATGAPVPSFDVDANGSVLELVSRAGWLYAGGKFTTIGGRARSGMARIDPMTGAIDPSFDIPFTTPPRSGTMGVPEFDVTADGSRLVAIGNFSEVDGLSRVQIAMLDLTSSPVSVASWETDEFPAYKPGSTLSYCQSTFSSYMRDVDFSPDGSYFAVVTTGANRPNRLCDTTSRWETYDSDSGLKPSWVSWTGGDSIISVAATGAAVYIGGHQQWVNNPYIPQDCGVCTNPGPGGIAREGIAALDPLNGLPFSWNPGRSRGLGVLAFLSTDEGLWAGSDTDRLADENHPKLGFFPTAGGTTIKTNDPYTLPGQLYNMDLLSGELFRRSYDLTTMGATQTVPAGVDWRTTRGAFALNGSLFYGSSDGNLYERTFDGDQVGPATKINLHGLEVAPEFHTFLIPGTSEPVPSLAQHLKAMTGMFFDQGRIYYTVRGDARLYYRGFTPESRTVGASLYVASTGNGVRWANIRGMTLASGKLIYANTKGKLFQVDFAETPSGTPQVIGGPAVDGINWASRGIFAFN